MENDGVDFTMGIPDAFLFHFAALVLTPTVQEATADGGEQQDVWVSHFQLMDRSCDDEISIKGLDITVLAEGLKNWELTPNAVDSSVEGTSDNPETDSSDEDVLLSLFNTDPSPLTAGDSLSASSVRVPLLPASSASAPAPTASSASSARTRHPRRALPAHGWRLSHR